MSCLLVQIQHDSALDLSLLHALKDACQLQSDTSADSRPHFGITTHLVHRGSLKVSRDETSGSHIERLDGLHTVANS